MTPRSGMACRAALCASLIVTFLAAPGALAAQVTLEEFVAMSDGTRLETLILLPDAAGGPFPVLLVRTPYEYDYESQFGMATMFGYAVVVQYTRGAGRSEDSPQAFRTDREDGHETLDWLLAQSWCDGRVAMGGGSALAIPAYLMAPGADPGLQCQLLAIASGDLYADTVFNGGVFRQNDVQAWLGWVDANDWLSNLETHRNCDDWWTPLRLGAADGLAIRTAAVHFGGWYDVFTQGTINGYKLWRTSADPTVADRQFLIMGPFDHYNVGGRGAGPRTFPENASMDLIATTISYLQWCFDGYNDVVDAWPRVQYYLMGPDEPDAPGNEWRHADDWPVPADETRLYLAAGGGLGLVPPAEDGLAAVPLDPADPSPTVGGRNLTGSLGAEDQARVEARSDAISFTSEPLSAPLEVVGRLYATLRVIPAASDADVAVRVTDVYPDGRSILLTDGIQRLSRRDGCEAPSVVTPGTAVDVDVDLWSTAYVFAAGHRVRVIVTASSHPRFEMNPVLRSLPAGTAFTLALPASGTSALRLPIPRTVEPPPEVVEVADMAEDVPTDSPDVVETDVPSADMPPSEGTIDAPQTDVPFPDAVDDALPLDAPADAVTPTDLPTPHDLPEDTVTPTDLPTPHDLPEDAVTPTDLPDTHDLAQDAVTPTDLPAPHDLAQDAVTPTDLPATHDLAQDAVTPTDLPAQHDLPEDAVTPTELPSLPDVPATELPARDAEADAAEAGPAVDGIASDLPVGDTDAPSKRGGGGCAAGPTAPIGGAPLLGFATFLVLVLALRRRMA